MDQQFQFLHIYLKNLNNKFKDSKKAIKRISENTIVETIDLDNQYPSNKIVTVTLHRTENITSKKKLNKFVDFLEKISETHTLNWYLHEPTRNYLDKFNISIPSKINLFDLLQHDKFLVELKKSDLVVTDGGSIQEECYFLGKKTIIWRNATERRYALNRNMFLSNLDVSDSLKFIHDSNLISDKKYKLEVSPSKEIVGYLTELYSKR